MRGKSLAGKRQDEAASEAVTWDEADPPAPEEDWPLENESKLVLAGLLLFLGTTLLGGFVLLMVLVSTGLPHVPRSTTTWPPGPTVTSSTGPGWTRS